MSADRLNVKYIFQYFFFLPGHMVNRPPSWLGAEVGSQFYLFLAIEIASILVANVVNTWPLPGVCSSVLVTPVSWPEVAVSRDDIIDRSKPLEN